MNFQPFQTNTKRLVEHRNSERTEEVAFHTYKHTGHSANVVMNRNMCESLLHIGRIAAAAAVDAGDGASVEVSMMLILLCDVVVAGSERSSTRSLSQLSPTSWPCIPLHKSASVCRTSTTPVSEGTKVRTDMRKHTHRYCL